MLHIIDGKFPRLDDHHRIRRTRDQKRTPHIPNRLLHKLKVSAAHISVLLRYRLHLLMVVFRRETPRSAGDDEHASVCLAELLDALDEHLQRYGRGSLFKSYPREGSTEPGTRGILFEAVLGIPCPQHTVRSLGLQSRLRVWLAVYSIGETERLGWT